jgi:multiple sugar transport system substrate-binding protein/raffinose/stachyose/melibiose transport system substrate-binding protein
VSKIAKLGVFITLLLMVAVPMAMTAAQGPQYVTYNSYNGDPIPRAFDEKVVQMWNDQNPLMPVEHSIIAHEDFKQALRAYLTADPAPDVLTWFAGNRARFFIDKGLIADISDVFADQGFNESYAPGFLSLASVGDKQYFLPTAYYWWAVYYRPSLFEKAGLPKCPKPGTIPGRLRFAERGGITPITIGTLYP